MGAIKAWLADGAAVAATAVVCGWHLLQARKELARGLWTDLGDELEDRHFARLHDEYVRNN
jgi:hypothetical protein